MCPGYLIELQTVLKGEVWDHAGTGRLTSEPHSAKACQRCHNYYFANYVSLFSKANEMVLTFYHKTNECVYLKNKLAFLAIFSFFQLLAQKTQFLIWESFDQYSITVENILWHSSYCTYISQGFDPTGYTWDDFMFCLDVLFNALSVFIS